MEFGEYGKVDKVEEVIKCPIILEGGSFHVDGEGTVLVTEECLLNSNRNPTLSKEEIEVYLNEYLDTSKVIWLPNGLVADDDTNGHIDNFACFVRPGVICLAWTDDESDPQYEISLKASEIIKSEKDAAGRDIEVVKIYTPKVMHMTTTEHEGVSGAENFVARSKGQRLAGSYINFYIANKAFIIPGFGDAEFDKKAVEDLRKVSGDREVIQIDTRNILIGGGNIHCVTQQVPKVI